MTNVLCFSILPNGLRNPQGRERKTINLFKAFKIKRDVALVGFTLCWLAWRFCE